jgi:hypothetical protein
MEENIKILKSHKLSCESGISLLPFRKKIFYGDNEPEAHISFAP